MKKKIMSVLLVMVLLLACAPMGVSAEGDAVATLHANGELVGEYATLDDAFVAARGYKLVDNAVVTLLCDIDSGNAETTISGCYVTFDLNGKTLSRENGTVLSVKNSSQLTIIGEGTVHTEGSAVTLGGKSELTIENGDFSGYGYTGYGISVSDRNSKITINGGNIYGEYRGITGAATVIVNGGSVSGEHGIVSWNGKGYFTVNGGSVSGTKSAFANTTMGSHALTVNGGEITGYIQSDDVTLTGGTFVGGISCSKTLNSVLGEDKAYWQGDTMLQVADDVKKITGGDVTVKDACHHEKGTPAYVDNGDDHTVTYSCCHITQAEAHVFDHVYDGVCPCSSTREVEEIITFGGNSVSENVSGLAFRFDVAVDGMQAYGTVAIYDTATIGGYKVLGMGATAANNVETIDIPCVYLCDLESESCSYAIRIKKIPTDKYDENITVVPYVVLEMDGEVVTVYGAAQIANYNEHK